MAVSNTSSELPTASHELAKYGIALFINNRATEAEELFKSNINNISMSAGYSFSVFMDAIMSFEEDKMQLALNVLRETEKKCAGDIGWLKNVKTRMFGQKSPDLADRLETQIILADTQVCVALITFLQQEFSGYLKGGWVLRKAWKVYQQTYTEILELFKKKFGNFNLPEPTDFEWTCNDRRDTVLRHSNVSSPNGPSNSNGSTEWVVPEPSPSPPSSQRNGDDNISAESVERLMGAVCFGYGALQLGISLLPPSLLKVTNFLGFQGNRNNGISNLMYSRKGTDMRAPLATLALLWFHTIVRPFYALDGSNVKAGAEAANLLIQESIKDYGDSALFLFFRGRIHRLDGNIGLARESFQAAANNSSHREIKLLALHDVGWCHLIQLDFEQTQKVFLKLKHGSRWSKAFYAFLSIICSGSCNRKDFSDIMELTEICFVTYANRNTQLDEFLRRRVKVFPDSVESLEKTTSYYWKFFVYELLYLWNTLPSCNTSDISSIINDCNETVHEPMPGLAMLIQGECYCLLGYYENAITSFRNCIATRLPHENNSKDDIHISANAEYSLGVLLLREPDTKNEGKTLLEHASEYKDFDFDNKLHVRIMQALKSDES